jgi:hypothetical protein
MTFTAFKESLNNSEVPVTLSPYLKTLWYDGKADWEKAHTIIQDTDDTTAAWIHAYLHRKEGDIATADYWYTRAGRKKPSVSLEEEWNSIAIHLLS